MNDTWSQIVGITAGILTSVALLPQVIKIYREKKSEQISIGYLVVLMAGQSLWIVYGIMKSDIPVVGTNIFSISVSVLTIILGIKYKSR